ncbi:hypothetical protein [Pseudomonas aeruginosa]|uniref:LysM peptidoglycan-binding domain-containing protein n=1 Tax=Pseudomonas aeruginosa TaxID=287 RepID=UPI003138EC34
MSKELNKASVEQAEPASCQGNNCGTTTGDHSSECLAEAAASQGWELKPGDLCGRDCPMRPAPAEQAGGDERDLQGAQGGRDGWGPFPIVQVPWNVFDRAVMWVEDRRRYGDDGTIVDDWKALKTIQRAALAQPSPAQAEQAEAERPDVVAVVRAQGFGRVCEADANTLYQHCSDGDELMTVAQHAASVARWAEMFNRVEQERDAALAEVAGLRSLLNSLLCYVERDINRMRSDRDKSDNKEIYDRSISLAMERLKAAQNAVFTTEPGCDTAVELAAQTTQAQHSVPEEFIGRLSEFLAQRGATGKALLRELRDMLAAAPARGQHSVPAYVSYTTRPAESLAGIALRQLKDESRWVEIRDINAHAFPDMQSHSYYPAGTVIKLPAAAPGKEGNDD